MQQLKQEYHLTIQGNISGIGFSWFLTKKLKETNKEHKILNKDIKKIELTITCTEQELNKLIQEINNFNPFDKYKKKTKNNQKNKKQQIIELIEITQKKDKNTTKNKQNKKARVA